MELNALGMSQFDTFDDEVSKESNDLTVDAGLSPDGPFLSSVAQPDLSQGLSIGSGTELGGHSESSRRKGGWTKGKKRKKGVRDSNAPKQPLSGYLRFLTERRELLRREQPSLSFADVSKLLGAEWSSLAQHHKQRYLEEADKEKEQYVRDLEAYQKTESYRAFRMQMDKRKEEGQTTDVLAAQAAVSLDQEESGTFDIPIFTQEFLDHNKAREAELRQLRRQSTELEEQNAVLSKHSDNMRQAVSRLQAEAQQHRANNAVLTSHLDALRARLTAAFSALPLPGSGHLPSVDSIDTYMARLHSLILDSPHDNEQLIATVRDVVGRLHLDIDTSKVR
ncbi:high mobility group protein 20A [Aplysia californica]|uniref:High mobility group protein 20A n=1 Tax=Aplysia californica TaxID=6500 RepID=A0ABM1W1J3_APLCA|nr:high mobility group protein 20A [Aplysia californica]